MANVGYARVSTQDQNLSLQLDALAAAGCGKVFEDRASGARADRVGLQAALDYVRDGEVLVVWKLDRLGRSLPHLIQTVSALAKCGVGFGSLTEAIDTTTPSGRLVFHIFGALGQFERDLSQCLPKLPKPFPVTCLRQLASTPSSLYAVIATSDSIGRLLWPP